MTFPQCACGMWSNFLEYTEASKLHTRFQNNCDNRLIFGRCEASFSVLVFYIIIYIELCFILVGGYRGDANTLEGSRSCDQPESSRHEEVTAKTARQCQRTGSFKF